MNMPAARIFEERRRAAKVVQPSVSVKTDRGPSPFTVIGVPACTVGLENPILVNKPLLLLSENIHAAGTKLFAQRKCNS